MINSGSSRDLHCMVLLRELADLQRKHQFDVIASWVPRFFNDHSDFLTHQQVGWSLDRPVDVAARCSTGYHG